MITNSNELRQIYLNISQTYTLLRTEELSVWSVFEFVTQYFLPTLRDGNYLSWFDDYSSVWQRDCQQKVFAYSSVLIIL
jgi:hypothetical protein